MRTLAGLSGAVLLVVMASGGAHADIAMNGTFAITHACPAYQSIRNGTNPGAVTVEPGKSYAVLSKNKPDATHYRLHVDGAKPVERWVSTVCGTISANEAPTAGKATQTPGATAAAKAAGDATGVSPTHVLAMSWEPAFCSKHADKGECRTLTSTGFAATHLSLHGLWPQPRGTQYCGVAPEAKQYDQNHDWASLPEPAMTAETLQRLGKVMPGVESKLQRHEWIVHGTCFGGTADGYFARAATLAESVDASKVSELFAGNVGQSLSAQAIRSAFDDAFGVGAGARVAVSCSGRGANRKITELVINLAGDVTGTAGLGDLMRAAQVVSPGCPSGFIDRAPQ